MPGFDDVNNCSKPVIAPIDGYRMAGGMEIALYCDIRLATRKSTFAMPEPKRHLLSGPAASPPPAPAARDTRPRVLCAVRRGKLRRLARAGSVPAYPGRQ
jgi:hypothetical protein